MILPNRHILLSESLFGLSSFVLGALVEPKTLDQVWLEFEEAFKVKSYPFNHSFENMVLAVDLLFIFGAINSDEQGNLMSCKS